MNNISHSGSDVQQIIKLIQSRKISFYLRLQAHFSSNFFLVVRACVGMYACNAFAFGPSRSDLKPCIRPYWQISTTQHQPHSGPEMAPLSEVNKNLTSPP